MNIYLDLETLPSADPAVRDMLGAKIAPPGNISKAETIAKWEAETKPGLIDEAVKKTALDGTFGSIAVIGLAFGDASPMAFSAPQAVRSEHDMLRQFMATIDTQCTSQTRPIFGGHNLHGFDLPFLWKRCVINGVKPSPWLPLGVKPWSDRIADTMLMWDDNREKRISLDNLCRVLGIKSSKGDLDGSKAAEHWEAGRYQEVIDYCCADIVATRECHRRLTFQ